MERMLVGGMMVLFFLTGLGLAGQALRLLLLIQQRRPHLMLTQGIVKEYRGERPGSSTSGGFKVYFSTKKSHRKNRLHYFPRVEYLTPSGERHTFESPHGDHGPKRRYRVGQTVPVLFDPEGRIEPVIQDRLGIWFKPLNIGLAGLLSLGGSLIIWVAFGQQILGQ
jgi:hypothetical protein